MLFFHCINTLEHSVTLMALKVEKYIINKVREKRIEKGLSQSQLSFELGYASPGFIAMVESGRYAKKYNIQQLNEIAKVLECRLWDLLPEYPV